MTLFLATCTQPPNTPWHKYVIIVVIYWAPTRSQALYAHLICIFICLHVSGAEMQSITQLPSLKPASALRSLCRQRSHHTPCVFPAVTFLDPQGQGHPALPLRLGSRTPPVPTLPTREKPHVVSGVVKGGGLRRSKLWSWTHHILPDWPWQDSSIWGWK